MIFIMSAMPGERESVNHYFPQEVTPIQKDEVYFRQETTGTKIQSKKLCKKKKKKQNRDFPGGPVVKNPLLNAEVTSLIAGWETKTPCATEQFSLCATTEEPAHQQTARVPPRPSAARTQTPKQLCAAQSQCEEGLNSGAVLMEVFLINMECG